MLLHSPLLQQSLLLALPPLSDMLKLGGSLPAPQATEHAALRRQPHTLTVLATNHSLRLALARRAPGVRSALLFFGSCVHTTPLGGDSRRGLDHHQLHSTRGHVRHRSGRWGQRGGPAHDPCILHGRTTVHRCLCGGLPWGGWDRSLVRAFRCGFALPHWFLCNLRCLSIHHSSFFLSIRSYRSQAKPHRVTERTRAMPHNNNRATDNRQPDPQRKRSLLPTERLPGFARVSSAHHPPT